MALPVIKATRFNYGAYAQPKQVRFKDPNAGIVAGIASVGRQVVQKIEENKLQEQKNNITIAKNTQSINTLQLNYKINLVIKLINIFKV